MATTTTPSPPRPTTPSRLELVLRQAEYWKTVYLRTWKGSAVSSFVTPLLYVVAMGLLLGGFIDSGDAQLEGA